MTQYPIYNVGDTVRLLTDVRCYGFVWNWPEKFVIAEVVDKDMVQGYVPDHFTGEKSARHSLVPFGWVKLVKRGTPLDIDLGELL